MDTIGQHLKKLREEQGFSQKEVHKATGIADSTVSRIESGQIEDPSPRDLLKLAALYGANILSLYVMAGYLDQNFLCTAKESVFKGVSLLDDEEFSYIQKLVGLFAKRRTSESEA